MKSSRFIRFVSRLAEVGENIATILQLRLQNSSSSEVCITVWFCNFEMLLVIAFQKKSIILLLSTTAKDLLSFLGSMNCPKLSKKKPSPVKASDGLPGTTMGLVARSPFAVLPGLLLRNLN